MTRFIFIFCKKISFQCDFEFFHYIIVLDNSRFTQTFIYHLTSCDKSRFSVVIRNFAFKNNSMNNPHNIFLKISNLGFVRQRHWQKSWECQWVGLRMIGACLMNGLSTVADTRANQPYSDPPSLHPSGPRSHTAQAAREEVWAAVLHCKNVLLVVPNTVMTWKAFRRWFTISRGIYLNSYHWGVGRDVWMQYSRTPWVIQWLATAVSGGSGRGVRSGWIR